jgi:hypothetical protein
MVTLAGDTGACITSSAFGAQNVAGTRMLPGGDVIVSGRLGSGSDLGCGSLPAGEYLAYVSRRRFSDGSCVWGREISNAVYGAAVVAVDASSSIYAATMLGGSTTFAGQTVTSSGDEALLLKYGSDGSEVWAQHWGLPIHPNDSVIPTSIVVTPDQNVWMAGTYTGQATFGTQTLPVGCEGSVGCEGGEEGFVAGATPTGELVAATSLFLDNAQLEQIPMPLAADASGALFVAVQYGGNLHVGGGGVVATGNGMLLAKLDPSAGLKATWTKVFTPATPNSLHIDSCGDLLMTGAGFVGSNLGCGSTSGPMTTNGLWARLGL